MSLKLIEGNVSYECTGCGRRAEIIIRVDGLGDYRCLECAYGDKLIEIKLGQAP